MTSLRLAVLATALALAVVLVGGSEAAYTRVGYTGSGIELYGGPYPHYYNPKAYRHYHYEGARPTYKRYRYERPSRYYAPDARCERWSRQCAITWGATNGPDYNGCLRYHGCP